MLKRVWRHGTGEIKVTLYMVDAVREGQGHAGSTPATSTILIIHSILNLSMLPMFRACGHRRAVLLSQSSNLFFACGRNHDRAAFRSAGAALP